MNDSQGEKRVLIAELTESAIRLWGSKRTQAANHNIKEAADHILKINGADIDDGETPIFHPPIQNHDSSA